MPLESKAQARWAYANQGKDTREGAAAREYIAASHGMSLKKLPERKKLAKRGRVFGSMAPE